VLVDGMSQMETAVATEFFGSPPPGGPPWYSFRICSDGARELRLQGMRVTTDAGPEAIRQADTVIIPGWSHSDDPASPELIAELQRAHRRGARMVSFCTGAFPLAQAGLLDGLEATTHWSHAEKFRARFPLVRLNPSALYVDSGQVLTSAGSASAIDLALHIIRVDHGADVANDMARAMVVPPHREGGQAQFIESPMPQTRDGDVEPFAATLDWAIEHLDEPLSIEVMAAHAAMSPRHFSRRFKETTGTTPHRWLLGHRLDLARRLLETTEQSIDVVAARAGFGTATAMRQHFRADLHTTPQAYRRTFDCCDLEQPA
jgi:transcriptional regulator GlxA family with amidase domain